MGGWAAGEGLPEAGSGGGQAAMFNVECWILDGGGGGKLGVIR
jgi:hypothetical protein